MMFFFMKYLLTNIKRKKFMLFINIITKIKKFNIKYCFACNFLIIE